MTTHRISKAETETEAETARLRKTEDRQPDLYRNTEGRQDE